MNTRTLGVLALGAALLSGCSMNGPGQYQIHEALLYGAAQERIGWVYGTLGGSNAAEIKLGDQTLTLRPQVEDPLALPGTLSVNGKATYRAPTSPVGRKLTVTRNPAGGFTVQANGAVESVYYTDGQRWFKLAGQLGAGSVTRSGATPNVALRGAGQLTDAEADALGQELAKEGPLAVAVLPEADLPDPAPSAQPAPSVTRRTGLYLQSGVPTTSEAASGGNLGSNGGGGNTSGSATTGTGSGAGMGSAGGNVTASSVNARELGRGSNSTYSNQAASVVLARSQAELNSAWRTANGNLLPTPSAPSLDFSQNSAVVFFLGQRPTGGYGVRFVSARAGTDGLLVTVDVASPGPGTITTQALTSPWLALQIPGTFGRVTVQNTQGQVLAQTK